MLKHWSLFFIVVLLVVPLAPGIAQVIINQSHQPGRYLCVTDPAAAGIEFKSSQQAWLPTIFTMHERYVITVNRPADDGKPLASVTLYGDNVPYWICRATVTSGALLCAGKSSLIVFNANTMRFIESFFDGYIDGVDGGLNFPYIVAGSCKRL